MIFPKLTTHGRRRRVRRLLVSILVGVLASLLIAWIFWLVNKSRPAAMRWLTSEVSPSELGAHGS